LRNERLHRSTDFWSRRWNARSFCISLILGVKPDALIASQKLSALEEQQKREVTALTEAVTIETWLYLGGLASYEVLEAQPFLYPAEFSLPETSRHPRLTVVQLYNVSEAAGVSRNTQFTEGH
jgi:hypothetical protein